jgi:hypothetical protein
MSLYVVILFTRTALLRVWFIRLFTLLLGVVAGGFCAGFALAVGHRFIHGLLHRYSDPGWRGFGVIRPPTKLGVVPVRCGEPMTLFDIEHRQYQLSHFAWP